MSEIFVSEVLGNGQMLDGGAMFGNAPRSVWETWIKPDEQGRIPLACRAMLVEIDGQKILCETGIGAFFEPKMAQRFGVQNSSEHCLLKNLKKLNVSPDQIDFVILSHLHFDHAGGLLSSFEEKQKGHDELVFSRAKFVVGRDAWERAKNPHFRDRASFVPELQEKLEASGRLLIVDGEKHSELPSAISFFVSNGHTPGQMHTKVSGSLAKIIFAGDLVPGVPWVHLPITMGYDRFPEQLIDEKKHLYNDVMDDQTYLFFTHDNDISCAKIRKDEKGKFAVADAQVHPVRFKI